MGGKSRVRTAVTSITTTVGAIDTCTLFEADMNAKVLVGVGAALGIVLALVFFFATGAFLYAFMDGVNHSFEQGAKTIADEKGPMITSDPLVLLARFSMARVAFACCGLMVGLA